MANHSDTSTDPIDSPDSPNSSDESLLDDEESLELAPGDRGRKQLWLYLLSLPFWFLIIFVPTLIVPKLAGAYGQALPGMLFDDPAALAATLEDMSATILGVAAVVGITGVSALILRLGVGIEERLRLALVSFSIPFWMIVMWYSYTQLMPRGQYAVAFLGGILGLYVISELDEPLIERNWLEVGLLVGSGLISLATSGYLFVNYQSVAVYTVGRASEPQLAMAFAFTLAMIYLTWRSFGITFLAVVLIGIGYGFAGPFMPGALSHGGLSGTRMLRILVVSVDGFYGFLTRLVAAWIALFLLYAGLLKAYGAFDLILRIAVRSAKYVDSGIAQTAVVASAVIGSVNGSQTANAGMTGSFTIPLMKENGIKPETAGGIEAVASTSGQVLPPVMGAGAFIMANLVTGITYVDVIVSGLIPAAILVVSITIAVHYVAAPQIENPEMDGLIGDKMERRAVALESVKYGIPSHPDLRPRYPAVHRDDRCAVHGSVDDRLRDRNPDAAGRARRREHQSGAVRDAETDGRRLPRGSHRRRAGDDHPRVDQRCRRHPDGDRSADGDLADATRPIGRGPDHRVRAGDDHLYHPRARDADDRRIHGRRAARRSDADQPVPRARYRGALLRVLRRDPRGAHPTDRDVCRRHLRDIWRGLLGGCKEALRISAPLFVLPFAFVYHPELVSGTFNYASLSAGLLAMIGSLAIIHGINYRFVFGRGQTYGLRVAFFVAGVIGMVHPTQMVQIGAIAAVGALYVLQVVVGRPNPLGTLRGAAGVISGRKR